MYKMMLVSAVALSLAGCTVREQQLATAGVAGAIIGAGLTQPQPQPVYVEERPVVVHRRVHRCYTVWENTYRGYVERRVCDNHIP